MKDRLPNLKAIVQYLPGEVDEEQRAQGVMSCKKFYMQLVLRGSVVLKTRKEGLAVQLNVNIL